MPLLDLKLWVSEEEEVKFVFYAKDVSSKYFIPFKSGHSQSMKRSMLANEGLRRLLNISPELPWGAFIEVMDEFAVKMWRKAVCKKFKEEHRIEVKVTDWQHCTTG